MEKDRGSAQGIRRKYRMLIENIQDGVFIIQDAKIKFLNEAFGKNNGYTAEELVG